MAHTSQQERAQTNVFLQQEIVDLTNKEDLEQQQHLHEDLKQAQAQALERRESKIESVQKRNQLLRETIEQSFTPEQQAQKERLLQNLQTAHAETLDEMHQQGEIDVLDKYAQKILPPKWSMNIKRGTTYGTIVTGALVGTYIAYRFIKGLFGKAKETVVTTIKKTSKKLLIGGAGLLSLLGIDQILLGGAARKWLTSLNVVGEAKEKIAQAGKAVKEKAAEGAKAVQEGAAAVVEKGREAKKWAEDQRSSDDADKPAEAVKKSAEQTAQNASVEAAKTGLALQYDVIGTIDPTQKSPRPFLNDAREIMDLATDNRVRMGRFIDCMETTGGNEAPYEILLKETYPETYDSFSEQRRKELIVAAKLVVGYLQKFRNLMEKHAQSRGQDLRTIEMKEAVNVFAYSSERSQQLAERLTLSITNFILSGEVPNPVPIIKDVLEHKKEYSDQMVTAAILPLTKLANVRPETPEKKQQLREAAGRVSAFFMASGDVTINALEDRMKTQGWPENGAEQTIVRAVCGKIRQKEFIDHILRSILVPPNPTETTEKEIARVLNTMAKDGSMKLRDAFEIYILQENGQLSGVMSFFKTLQLLKENGHQDLAINRYHEVIDRFIGLAEEGADSLKDFAEKLSMTEEQAQEVHNLYLLSKEEAEEGFWAWIINAWEFAQRHPKIAATIGILLGTPAAIIGGKVTWKLLKIRAKWQQTKIINFAEMTETQVKALAERYGVPFDQVRGAREDAKQIRDKLTSAAERFRWPWEGYRARKRGRRIMKEAKKKPAGLPTSETDAKESARTERHTEEQTAGEETMASGAPETEPAATPKSAAETPVSFNPQQYHERMRARIDGVYLWSRLRGAKWRQAQLQRIEDELTTYESAIRNRQDVPQNQKTEIFGLLSEVGAARESHEKAEQQRIAQLEQEAAEEAKIVEAETARQEALKQQNIAKRADGKIKMTDLVVTGLEARWKKRRTSRDAGLQRELETQLNNLGTIEPVSQEQRGRLSALRARLEGLQTEITEAQKTAKRPRRKIGSQSADVAGIAATEQELDVDARTGRTESDIEPNVETETDINIAGRR